MERLVHADPLQQWLINFSSRNTRSQYGHWFEKFQTFAGKNAKQLLEIAETKEGRRQIDFLTKQFYDYLVKDGYTRGSATTIMTAVRSFFTYNAERLPKLPHAFSAPFEPAFEQRRVLTPDEFQKMIEKAKSPFEQLVLWMVADGGQRRGVYTALKTKHLKTELAQDTPVVIAVPSELFDYRGENVNKGRRVAYRFGFTAGTVNRLLDHLEQRRKNGEKITAESWLLSDRGKPPSAKRINEIVERTAKDAGIQRTVVSAKKGRMRTIHAHIFRGFLNDRLKAIGEFDDIFRNMILSHRPPYAAAYDRYTDERILDAYRKLGSSQGS